MIQTTRGNRLRKSEWLRAFNKLDDIDNKILYEWVRTDKATPSHIDKAVAYESDHDLKVSHIGVYSNKRES
jgi:hypothetical protein